MRDPFSQRLHNEMNIRILVTPEDRNDFKSCTAGTAETTGTYGRLEAGFV
jgi:hypothetical protein